LYGTSPYGLHAEGGDYIGYQEEGRQEAGEEGEEEVNPSQSSMSSKPSPVEKRGFAFNRLSSIGWFPPCRPPQAKKRRMLDVETLIC
jgi:hypothetical protein